MSHILVNREWADIIQPQDTLDAEGILPPRCHNLEAEDNPYIPQLGTTPNMNRTESHFK